MEISDNKRHIFGTLAVYGGLFAFGSAYNAIIGRLERNGLDEGYTSDLVVGGVLVTVAATAPLVGIRRAAFVLGAFVASGLPMSIGAKIRYRRMRERERGYGYTGTGVKGATAGQRPATEARFRNGGATGRIANAGRDHFGNPRA